MSKKTLRDILPLCSKIAQEFDYELIDVAMEKESTGSYLRIYLDKKGGLTLDDCEKYHKKIQALVEEVDYDFLEVSSPGIDRPLKKEKDFLRALGTLVQLRLYKNYEGRKNLIGTLVRFEEETVYIKNEQEQELAFALKDLALVKPYIDMDTIEQIEF